VSLHIREIRSPEDRAIGPAHRLLHRMFPRAELLPLRDWRYALRERAAGLWTDLGWHLIAAEVDGRVHGVATANYIGNVNVGMVGYIGVDARGRAGGVGGDLRERLREVLQRDAMRMRGVPLRAIVGEVHAYNPWLRHLVRYSGALALDFPYRQPSIRSAEKTVPLVLYYQGLDRRRRSLRTEEIRRLIYAIWRRVYRVARPVSRRPFQQMLRSLPPGTRIGALDLSEFGSPAGPSRRRVGRRG